MTLTQGQIPKVKVIVHTHPKSVSVPQLLTAMLDLDNILHNCCPGLKSVSWPFPKVVYSRPMSQCTHTENLSPGHNSLLPSWIWIIFTQLLSMTQEAVMTLTKDYIAKVKGHSVSIPKILNSLLPCWIWIIFYTTVAMTQRVVMTLMQRHISKVKVTVHNTQNPCLGHNSSLHISSIWIIFQTIVDTRSYNSKFTVTMHTYPKFVSRPQLKCFICIVCHTLSMTQGYVMTSTQVSSRSMSLFTHCKILFSGHNLSQVTWMGIILHLIFVYVTRVVVAGVFVPLGYV